MRLHLTTFTTTKSAPHPFMIAASCYRADGLCVQQARFLVRPEGWEIPASLTQPIGVTTRDAAMYGVPIGTAMRCIKAMTEIASEWVAFDEEAVSASLQQGMTDAGAQTAWQARPLRSHCAMRASQALCGLKTEAGLDRAPTLKEALTIVARPVIENVADGALGAAHLGLYALVAALDQKGAFK